ncbi:MAG: hypothetical protein RL518_146 [Pseudomonadota bacterium]|jgi:uncharacterized membrane protein YfcA
MVALLLGSIVGLSLGLTGGGGSIFAVPLLVYGLSLDFREAVALSLAIVGSTALYGASLQARRKVVLWGAGAVLGLGGVATAPLGARLGYNLPDRLALMLFAGLMLIVGIQMIAGRKEMVITAIACQRTPQGELRFSWRCALKLLITGGIAGVLSGVFGVGGGFLLVPALLLVTGISIDSAMATSLVSIALISTSGFIANLHHLSQRTFFTATLFLMGSILGMTLGASVKQRLPSHTLRRIFATVVIGTAIVLLTLNAVG